MPNQISLYFHEFLKYLQSYSGFLSLANLNWITLILILALVAVFLIGVTFGRSRVLIGLLSLYVAQVIGFNFFYFDKLKIIFPNLDDRWLHLGVFVVLSMIVFLLLQRSTLRSRLSLDNSPIVFTVFFSILTFGFLVTLVLTYLPTEVYKNIQPDLLPYFTTKTAQFWWSVVPIISLIFLRQRG